jgi:hypothetical protein
VTQRAVSLDVKSSWIDVVVARSIPIVDETRWLARWTTFSIAMRFSQGGT